MPTLGLAVSDFVTDSYVVSAAAANTRKVQDLITHSQAAPNP
jgi:hypothetical protein